MSEINNFLKENKEFVKWAAIALAVLFIYKKVQKNKLFKSVFGGNDEKQSELLELIEADESGAIIQAATISEAQAEQYANTIKKAWGAFNDDENAIYGVFMQLRTYADLLLVAEKYGVWEDFWLSSGEDLAGSIQKRMNAKEIEQINKILSDKKINYAF